MKYNKIPNEIKMPVYWVEDENGTLVFDLDEMADTLTGRIKDALGLDISISMLELKETCPKCDQHPYSETDRHCPVCFDEIKETK